MASVFIQIDKPFYIAGDTVNGYIFLNLFENMAGNEVLIKFKGWESVRWFEERIVGEQERQTIPPHLVYNNVFRLRMDSSDSEDNRGDDECAKYRYVTDGVILKEITKYEGQRHIARFDSVLYNFGGNFIPAGQYSFPFSFKTGQNYPASFLDKSKQNDRRGRIKYEMQAFVRGFNDRLILLRTKQEIILREMSPIKNDQQQMQAHVTSCCCIDQGTTRIQCFFQKNGYVPGEDARIYCKLDNTEGKTEVEGVDVALLNEITYTSSEGYKKVFSETVFRKSFSGLGVGQQGERENVAKIVNANYGSHPEDIKPTARGNRLHSVYYLVVEANLAAPCTCCSDLPVVRQPILIYPFIPVNYNFNAPPNWSPKLMPAINLQVGLPSLGIKANPMNMNVNMNMNPNPMNVNMNNSGMGLNMTGPEMEMQIKMPPPTVHMHSNMNGGIQINSPTRYNQGMGVRVDVEADPYGGGANVRMF